ncbi:MAG: hypothetical protein C0616_10335 [Desulfuromonas sp.]|nr:MAG: hypothetical protein C0616_10335 [Desulfuromonas sp.]
MIRRRAKKSLDRFCLDSRQIGSPGCESLSWAWDEVGAVLSCRSSGSPEPSPERRVARFRYHDALRQWSLEQPRDEGWRLCLNIGPVLDFDRLIEFLDADPFGQFWLC